MHGECKIKFAEFSLGGGRATDWSETGAWWENLKERDHLEELGVDARILQDRQCTFNVTLWRVRVTIVTVETQQYLLCVLFSYMSLSTV